MPKNKTARVSLPGPLLERAEHWFNRPMLLFLLAAFPAVLAATSFYNAFLLSVITLLLTVTTQTLLSFVGGRTSGPVGADAMCGLGFHRGDDRPLLLGKHLGDRFL